MLLGAVDLTCSGASGSGGMELFLGRHVSGESIELLPMSSRELGVFVTESEARRELRAFFAGFSLSLKLSERHIFNAEKSLVANCTSLGGREVTEILARRELRFFFMGNSFL